MKKLAIVIKKFKSPRVRKRLKIALSVYAVGILLGIGSKVIYDIGYFNALALKDEKMAKRQSTPQVKVVLTKESAQRIVSNALKEDPANPQTTVERINRHNRELSSIVIEKDQVKKVAWIINMNLFFIGDIFDTKGYNLSKAVERKHNINNVSY
ncbi:MAG: hypothetical protein GQ569_00510 [Methylococcaceae bacterium]|nr:hypothetical protein [Methylococcaceae bacterium]